MLTRQQLSALTFIRDFTEANSVSPTYTEIAAHMGLMSKSSVSRLVDGLESRGFIFRRKHLERGIEVRRMPEVPASVYIPLHLREKVAAVCAREGIAVGTLVAEALAAYLGAGLDDDESATDAGGE